MKIDAKSLATPVAEPSNTRKNVMTTKVCLNSDNAMAVDSTRRSKSSVLSQGLDNYGKRGQLIELSRAEEVDAISIDKGTASGTTVFVGRGMFDQIVSATTYGETKWEELGVDDDKRWVVINGQRFECEHSPEEKAARKRAQKMNLIDMLNELDDERKKQKKSGKDNGPNQPRGNVEALVGNRPVMELLGKITGETTDEGILKKLSLS